MLCAKFLSLNALSFLDSSVCHGLASREGLSISGQGSLPPHPAHTWLWVLTHVDLITTSVVGCILLKTALMHPLGGSNHKDGFCPPP